MHPWLLPVALQWKATRTSLLPMVLLHWMSMSLKSWTLARGSRAFKSWLWLARSADIPSIILNLMNCYQITAQVRWCVAHFSPFAKIAQRVIRNHWVMNYTAIVLVQRVILCYSTRYPHAEHGTADLCPVSCPVFVLVPVMYQRFPAIW